MRYLILTLALIAGCAATPPVPQSRNLGDAGTTMGKIDVHAQDIVNAAKRTAPTDARTEIVDHAGTIRTLATQGQGQLDKARSDESQMAGTINNQHEAIALRDQTIERLNSQFWSPRQVRLAWIIVGGIVAAWALLGTSAVIAPLLGGVAGMRWSVLVVRLLPFANLFSIFRDRALGADTAAALAGAVKLKAARTPAGS